jgi:hypothetical protein
VVIATQSAELADGIDALHYRIEDGRIAPDDSGYLGAESYL